MNPPEGVQAKVRERGGGDQREGLCGAAHRLRRVPTQEEGQYLFIGCTRGTWVTDNNLEKMTI